MEREREIASKLQVRKMKDRNKDRFLTNLNFEKGKKRIDIKV
jgi:hypothetical protein